MGLFKTYHVTDQQILKVPDAYGLNGLTRLYLRLSALNEVAKVTPPHQIYDIRFDERFNDFIWCYRIERKLNVSWNEVDLAVYRAFGSFLSACATV